VEKSPEVLKALFQNVELAGVLSDRRVGIVAGPDAGSVEGYILSRYVPAIDGGLAAIPLKPWCELEDRFFGGAADEVLSAAARNRADYSAQAHFGKRWFSNILGNLPAVERAGVEESSRSVAHVTAAGPSLDAQVRILAERDGKSRLIATDTSLPWLVRSALLPDAIVSIDCQNYCYLHFMGGFPREVPLFLDLASPPILARRAERFAFFASSHPFVRYLSERWRAFPRVDTSGGNVTQAGISLARELGADTVHLYGADFSYPDGKPYARGTYLFDVFALRESRRKPSEGYFYSFLYRAEGTAKEWTGEGWRYTTPVLLEYRRSLLGALPVLGIALIPAKGKGLPIETGARGVGKRSSPGSDVRAVWARAKPVCIWRDFLGAYAEDLRGLPEPGDPLWQYFAGVTALQRDLWATLLPLAPSFGREPAARPSRAAALREARSWALWRISRAIQGPVE
jgi:hypothetical protein